MTTKQEISSWFEEGVAEKAGFMIVAVDWFDHTDYPIYCYDLKELYRKYDETSESGNRIMEVYNLGMDKETQLNEVRAFHMPARA